MTHKLCGDPECAVTYGMRITSERIGKAARKQRADTKIALDRLKSLSTIADEVQTIFNRCVVLEDKLAGYGCISCDTKDPNIQYCAGHFRSRGANSSLRFNRDNVFLQCNMNCNNNRGGNVLEAEKRILIRIGAERLEAVKNNNEVKKWTRDELYALKAEYSEKRKLLEKQWKDRG
jgi:hypothetical protein